MLLTSQNRESVFQASVANARDVVLAAVVAHRTTPSKRHYSGMRRTPRPLDLSMRLDHAGLSPAGSAHRLSGGEGQQPAGCDREPQLPSRIWASLVMSKIARG